MIAKNRISNLYIKIWDLLFSVLLVSSPTMTASTTAIYHWGEFIFRDKLKFYRWPYNEECGLPPETTFIFGIYIFSLLLGFVNGFYTFGIRFLIRICLGCCRNIRFLKFSTLTWMCLLHLLSIIFDVLFQFF